MSIHETKSNEGKAFKRLVIGSPDDISLLSDSFPTKKRRNFETIRLYYCDNPNSGYAEEFCATVVNDLDSILSCAKKANAHEVCVEPTAMSCDIFVDFAQQLVNIGIPLKVFPEQYRELVQAKVSMQDICLPDIKLLDKKASRALLTIKRLMDIGITISGLIFTSFLFPFVAICTKLTSPGPIFYKQERVGQHGKIIVIWKFRTMRQDAEQHTGPIWARENDERITRFGRFLRKIRFDELPQLINVLNGDMSFIGPRPERPYFINQFKEKFPFYIMRLQVKPGITGWAQVHVNYDRTIDDVTAKLQHDAYYIDHMSLILELKIILKTFKTVFGRKGAH